MGGASEIQAKMVTDNVTSIIDTGRWLIEQRPAETEAEPKFWPNSLQTDRHSRQ